MRRLLHQLTERAVPHVQVGQYVYLGDGLGGAHVYRITDIDPDEGTVHGVRVDDTGGVPWYRMNLDARSNSEAGDAEA